MCKEVEYTQKFITRFAKTHRMNYGRACKVGFMDLIIGAAKLMAEYNGLPNTSHIAQKITRMLQLNDTSLPVRRPRPTSARRNPRAAVSLCRMKPWATSPN